MIELPVFINAKTDLPSRDNIVYPTDENIRLEFVSLAGTKHTRLVKFERSDSSIRDRCRLCALRDESEICPFISCTGANQDDFYLVPVLTQERKKVLEEIAGQYKEKMKDANSIEEIDELHNTTLEHFYGMKFEYYQFMCELHNPSFERRSELGAESVRKRRESSKVRAGRADRKSNPNKNEETVAEEVPDIVQTNTETTETIVEATHSQEERRREDWETAIMELDRKARIEEIQEEEARIKMKEHRRRAKKIREKLQELVSSGSNSFQKDTPLFDFAEEK